ncbi:DMT family transporter [Isachenkonia alkalipeptolytica]|nr:DMT family transporter [Isachenkonia alkalipeptolytica]
MEDKALGKVYLIMGLGILGVSVSAVLIRSTEAPSTVIAMYRMVFTFLLFTPLVIKKGGLPLKIIGRRGIALALLSGFFLALHFAAWIESLKHTTIASSTVLVSLQPLFTATLGYFFYKERLRRGQIVGMGIAILGSAFIGLSDFIGGGGHFYGDLLAVLGGAFASVYVLLGRGLRKTVGNLDYVYLAYGSCSVTLLAANLLGQTPLTGYSGNDYLIFIGLAVFSTIGGHTVFNWALKYVEANKVSVALLGEPIGATMLGFLILREVPSQAQLISAGIILLGLYIFIKDSFQRKKTTAALS